MNESTADIIELIARLTRAGYRVTFEPKRTVYGMISEGTNIIVELQVPIEPRSGIVPADITYSAYLDMPLALPLILHPGGPDGILRELERAANLLAPEAH